MLLRYAWMLGRIAQPTKANAILHEGSRIDPNKKLALWQLTIVRVNDGQLSAATNFAMAGLRLAPNESTSHVTMGRIAYKSGRRNEARAHFREALRIDPSDAAAQSHFHSADRASRWVFRPVHFGQCILDRFSIHTWELRALFFHYIVSVRGTTPLDFAGTA